MKKLILIILAFFPSNYIFSQNAELNLSKGQDLYQKKEYHTALYYFNLVLKEDSTCIDAYLERASTYEMLGDYENALKDYNYVLIKNPECAWCYFGIGNIYDTYLNDKYRAIEKYTIGIELSLKNGNNSLAGVGYLFRAGVKESLGDQAGYINDLKKGAELNNLGCKSILEILDNMSK